MVTVIFLACCAAARSVDPPPSNIEKKNTVVSAALDSVVREELSKRFMRNFDTSLEMRENVDFLLAPALLVQNAISRDVVITYPSE